MILIKLADGYDVLKRNILQYRVCKTHIYRIDQPKNTGEDALAKGEIVPENNCVKRNNYFTNPVT